MRTPSQAHGGRKSSFPLQHPGSLSEQLCLLNSNVSQAGTWPRATEWPLGKSSSVPTSGKFPPPRLPAPPNLGSSNFQRVQRAAAKPRPPATPVSRCAAPAGAWAPRKTTSPSSHRAPQCAGVAAPRHPSPSSNCSGRSVPVFPPLVLMSPPSRRHRTLTANARRRVQPLCLLQEAERPVGLVALDGLEGDANTALGFILVGFHGGTRARNRGGGGRASEGLRQPPARRWAGGAG